MNDFSAIIFIAVSVQVYTSLFSIHSLHDIHGIMNIIYKQVIEVNIEANNASNGYNLSIATGEAITYKYKHKYIHQTLLCDN